MSRNLYLEANLASTYTVGSTSLVSVPSFSITIPEDGHWDIDINYIGYTVTSGRAIYSAIGLNGAGLIDTYLSLNVAADVGQAPFAHKKSTYLHKDDVITLMVRYNAAGPQVLINNVAASAKITASKRGV